MADDKRDKKFTEEERLLFLQQRKEALLEKAEKAAKKCIQKEQDFLLDFALSFDFCNKAEQQMIYAVICEAWNWGKQIK